MVAEPAPQRAASDAPAKGPTAADLGLPAPRQQGIIYWLGWLLTRSIGLVWLRMWPRGVRNIPRKGPVIFVANHQSHLDPPLLGCCSPRPVTFIARGTLAKHPIMRWLLPRLGTLLVHREAPAKSQMKAALQVLEAGGCIGVFPEGTRSRDGAVAEFRGGVEFLARRSKAQLVPVGIGGSGRSWGRGRSWPRPTKVTLRFGAPWSADDLRQPDALVRLRAAVGRLADAPLAAVDADQPRSNSRTPGGQDPRGPATQPRPDGPDANMTRTGAPAGHDRSTAAGEGG